MKMGSFKTESILYDAISPAVRIRQETEKYFGRYIGICAGLISLPITVPPAILYSGIKKLGTLKSGEKRKNQSKLENELSN